jgi:hypothetical protein
MFEKLKFSEKLSIVGMCLVRKMVQMKRVLQLE